jgi:hypothetical protein
MGQDFDKTDNETKIRKKLMITEKYKTPSKK